jgi:hypothetical protein
MHLNVCKARDISEKFGGQKTRWGAARPYPWPTGHPLLFFKTPSSPFTPHSLTKPKNIEPPRVSNSKFWVSFFQDLSRVWKKRSWVMSWVSSSASSFEKSLVHVLLICKKLGRRWVRCCPLRERDYINHSGWIMNSSIVDSRITNSLLFISLTPHIFH